MSSASDKSGPERDFIRFGENLYIGFLYGDVHDESAFLRTARSVWLEINSDNVEDMMRKILDFGVRKLEVPDPHFYFQAGRSMPPAGRHRGEPVLL